METLHHKHYDGTPFSTEITSVENEAGSWNSSKVSIFRDTILIGEYMRNYPSFGALTFCPFKIDTQWYALYSAHYTSVRVMKLHEDRIEDWCGQDPDANGFCPVEIYVPRYRSVKGSFEASGKMLPVSDRLPLAGARDRFTPSLSTAPGWPSGTSPGTPAPA